MLIFRKNISDVTRCDSTRSRLGTETCKTYMHIVAPVCHHQHTADHKSLGTTPTSPEHHLQDGGHFRALWGGVCIFQEVTARQPVRTFCQSRVLCPHRNDDSADTGIISGWCCVSACSPPIPLEHFPEGGGGPRIMSSELLKPKLEPEPKPRTDCRVNRVVKQSGLQSAATVVQL